ncbi:MAG TPA: hypothetical protein ENJ09_00130 [Planctomycetes bacterium]|nr:hypothetical protein [Planctomycetota bacterium]
MRRFQVPGQTSASAHATFSKKEKRRLIAMAVGSVIVFGAFLYSTLETRNLEESDLGALPPSEPQAEEKIFLPEIDPGRIDALVADSKPVDRVTLESDAVDALLDEARRLTPTQFEALGEVELNTEVISRIEEDPSAHRAKAFFARGVVDALRERERNGVTEYIGRLLLDDQSTCYFLTLALEDAPENGAYVRVDGLFLKVYSEEDQLRPGEWIEAPLLVGPKAVRSYRSFGIVDSLSPDRFRGVEDARVVGSDSPAIVRETPFEPLWYLMAYARDLPQDSIDWDEAPELDGTLLDELIADPEKWRLKPIRIPISRVQDSRVIRANENPARISSYTQGWLGNWGWQYAVRFMYPRPDPSIHLRDYAYGRGFFLHDFAFESQARGLRVAPLIVLTELHRFEPKSDPIWGLMAKVLLVSALVLIVLLFVLVRRENRKSREIEQELIRRRRARRARSGNARPAGT